MGAIPTTRVTVTFEFCGHVEETWDGTGRADLCGDCLAEHFARFDGFMGIQSHSSWVASVNERIRGEGRKRADLDKVARGLNHQSAHEGSRRESGSH